MRPQLPEHALVTLLRQCYTTPRCQLRSQSPVLSLHAPRQFHHHPRSRRFQTHHGWSQNREESIVQFAVPAKSNANTSPEEKNIAILGGGITGLSAAHYITREIPTAKVTVYEASDRLGGWLQSKTIDVGNGNIVFESGPRTLRPSTPAALTTLEIIDQLNLQDEILFTPKTSVAARNRFVYYPDHLVKMPGPGQDILTMMWNVFTEPVFQGWFDALLENSRPQRATHHQYTNPEVDDESVGSFLARRLGSSSIGDNMVSAVLHGIYAGDINQLSARSLMPSFWYDEAMKGSLSMAAIERLRGRFAIKSMHDVLLQDELKKTISQPLWSSMQTASVYTFKQGIGALSTALEKSLRANANVQFRTGHAVKKVEKDSQNGSVNILTTQNTPPQKYTHVVSTIFGKTLSQIADVPSLSSMHAVTVMVVNLYYENPELLPERGFGYLIPRSIAFEDNPEFALGVVFDSDATVGQDSAKGTKVTVMLGGHWWDGMDSYPDEEEGAAMAQSILLRHLKISAQPARVNVVLQRNCIPQYTVGHEARMRITDQELSSKWDGQLLVAGNSYTGVGLNDCVRAARDLVRLLQKDKPCTGLEGLVAPTPFIPLQLVRGPDGKMRQVAHIEDKQDR